MTSFELASTGISFRFHTFDILLLGGAMLAMVIVWWKGRRSKQRR